MPTFRVYYHDWHKDTTGTVHVPGDTGASRLMDDVWAAIHRTGYYPVPQVLSNGARRWEIESKQTAPLEVCETAFMVFQHLNGTGYQGQNERSMCVGDVVVVDGEPFIVGVYQFEPMRRQSQAMVDAFFKQIAEREKGGTR